MHRFPLRPILVLVLAAAAGCIPPRGPSPIDEAFRLLGSEKDEEYEQAFAFLLEAGGAAGPKIRQGLTAAPRRGFPMIAALYVTGGGDEAPLELRARHLALFEWPRAREEQNALVIPYVRSSIERDLVRTGRPALRILAEALSEDASSEQRAMGLVRVMLRIGGRGVADAVAPLLDRERELSGGVRVCDVAAGVLLHLGSQDLLLRAVSREALRSSAREWWRTARDRSEAEWIGEAAGALAERYQEKDLAGTRGVLELLVGETIEDPRDWRMKNPAWRPPAPPLHPETLLPKLSAGRAPAFAANRALEESTGMRLFVPRAERLGELCAALRLWEPPPDLEARWRRALESRFVRLSIDVVGYQPRREMNHLLWHHETTAHVTEDPSGKLEFVVGDEGYLLYVQSLDGGLRFLYGEYHESESEHRTLIREYPALRPMVRISPAFKACVVVSIDEVPGRRTPRSPDELFAETRRRLRKAAESSSGEERSRTLRALGYCQDPADRDLFVKEKAAEALLLLGDPAGLEGEARLEPHEIDMALRKATDPALRARLESMRAPR